ncbi:MAG: alpha/beta hydrolase [Planctomycetota bacterium]
MLRNHARPNERPEDCTVEAVRVESKALRGNPWGDPTDRELIAVLPPGYHDDAKRRYPVLWLLAGYYGSGRMSLNRNYSSPAIDERVGKLILQKKMPPVILALPDCMTALGGSQYLDSPAMGNYESYLCDELIPAFDATFRTIPTREGRGVLGKSSGGYGALRLAMRRPELFAAAASHSGDCYFEYCHVKDFPSAVNAIRNAGGVKELIDKIRATEKPKNDDTLALINIAMGACYSPRKGAPLGFDLPFDETTGELNEKVMNRWFENDPVRMVENKQYADALRSLNLLFLDCGTRDQWALHLGLRIFVERLKQLGIRYEHEEFDDDHMSISYRYDRSIPLLAKALAKS